MPRPPEPVSPKEAARWPARRRNAMWTWLRLLGSVHNDGRWRPAPWPSQKTKKFGRGQYYSAGSRPIHETSLEAILRLTQTITGAAAIAALTLMPSAAQSDLLGVPGPI